MTTGLNILREMGMLGRCVGKTMAICKAAKEIGATVICANGQQAAQVSRDHGVKTCTLGQEIRGMRGPFLADHFAVEMAANQALVEIKQLKEENDKLKEHMRIIIGWSDNPDRLKIEDDIKRVTLRGLDWIGKAKELLGEK